ncbi:MAG TPA: DUF4349 domain-containing protein [Terracidiphilus sp.]|nr:DUF4349 domain-containing protein [Terracidiphilus sp.]
MITIIHPAPEEIMALLDGELPGAEAQSLSEHIDHCVECSVVRDQLRSASETLAGWSVPAPSMALDRGVEEKLAAAPARVTAMPRAYTPWSLRNWRLWVIGGGGMLAGVFILSGILTLPSYRVEHLAQMQSEVVTQSEAETPRRPSSSGGVAGMEGYAYSNSSQPAATPPPPVSEVANESLKGKLPVAQGGRGGNPIPTPMIARTVSLTILVKNVAAARTALDTVLAKQQGYAAQLTLDTPENGARSFQASLRVPAPALEAALVELRSLGKVQTESQSGEEVTQQHADLVARLTNARETEQRLRQILAERTGKMEDVLDVEEKISETRGEIEQMEAEQKALEHRVDFATVDLRLVEEYKVQLGGASASVGSRLRNSFIAGLRNAGGSLLGIALFVEEIGPAALVWIVVLGIPGVLIWRRYRRARENLS